MSHYETPDYDVLEKEAHFEIREYKDFYMVEYDNPTDPDLSYGFGTLFKYISKSNDQNEKISMTIPVIKEVTAQGMKMAFVVPQSNWNNIPLPTDKRLTVTKFEKGTFAANTYSGSSYTKKEQQQIELLESWILKKDLKPHSNYMIAIYNGPYVPPMFKRNEILVRVSD